MSSKVYSALIMVFILIGLMISGSLYAAESAAEKRTDPMKPPPFALKKFKQAKNKLKAGIAKSQSSSQKVVKKAVPLEPLHLTSILISANRRVAIINDQMLVIGDSIKKAKLTKIEKNSASLIRNGKKITLRLNDDLTAIRKNAVETKL